MKDQNPTAAAADNNPADAEQSPRRYDVVLAKAHTHEGKQYAEADTIKVTKLERDWLAANDVIDSKGAPK